MANISVSKLSSFASNPEKYIEYKGGAFNKEAAKQGTKMHNKKGGLSWLEQIMLLIAVALIIWGLI